MRRYSEAAIFWLTAASAAASLISIAAMEVLMGAAVLCWIVTTIVDLANKRAPLSPFKWPSYGTPLLFFMAATLISLAKSPVPSVGWHPIQKFVLFAMGLLAVASVKSEERALSAYKLLIGAATVASSLAIAQFIYREILYLRTGVQGVDPTLLNRITGPLGHWMTFSGVQLLVWCAAIPALVALSKRWMFTIPVIGTALVMSNTRGVWLAAAVTFGFIAFALPRKILLSVLIPIVIISLVLSPVIIHRVSMSLDNGLATNYSRKVYLEVGTKMIKDHILFGVGPERVFTEFPNYYGGPLNTFYYGHLHNNFLQIAAERGIFALAAFLWFLIELFRSLLRYLRDEDGELRWTTIGSIGALIAFVLHGLTQFNFGDSEVLVLLLFIVSIPWGLALHAQEDPHSQPG
jgi:putative inorganic carbon (HCO3(-)) transporter